MIIKTKTSKTACGITLLISLLAYLSCDTGSSSNTHITWTQYGGGPDQSKYFEGTNISRENVKELQVAWSYSTEDNIPYMFQPIVVDTTMYVYAKNSSLIALSIVTGNEIW